MSEPEPARDARLELSAAEVYDDSWDHNGVPVSYPYTVRFELHEGRMAVRGAPPASARRTDGRVMRGSGTARGRVRDVVAVAFYPVALGARRRVRQVYVMSVWRRGENEIGLVDEWTLYSEIRREVLDRIRNDDMFRANNQHPTPGMIEMPVDETNFNVRQCLRFSQAEVDRSLDEDAWARFGWRARRRADGFIVVVALEDPASINDPLWIRHYRARLQVDF